MSKLGSFTAFLAEMMTRLLISPNCYCGCHLSVMNSLSLFKKPVWDDLSFVTVCYSAGRSHQKMLHCGHKGMDMVSNNTKVILGKSCHTAAILASPLG